MPNYYNSYVQPYIPQTQQNYQQIQNGGFVLIPNEETANSYPVAPGNCVTFKVEGKPIVIEKSMGFSQLETPKVKRFKLVEDSEESKAECAHDKDIESLKSDIKKMWGEINAIKNRKTRPDKNGES